LRMGGRRMGEGTRARGCRGAPLDVGQPHRRRRRTHTGGARGVRCLQRPRDQRAGQLRLMHLLDGPRRGRGAVRRQGGGRRTDAGWGDGLPVVPPTEGRVREWCAASGRFPEELLAELPPRNGRCTVEKLAVNTVLAGAPAASMPLLCAAVEAMAAPDFNLFALNTTTSCFVPGVFVNGLVP